MGFGEMGNWDIEEFLLTVKLIKKCFFLKINTPIFHHSLAQTWFAWTRFYTFGLRDITVTT